MDEASELFRRARQVVARMCEAELALRPLAEQRLYEGASHLLTIGAMRADLSVSVDERFRFRTDRRPSKGSFADIHLRIAFEPAREPTSARMARPELITRVMDFVHVRNDDPRRLQIKVPTAEMSRGRLDIQYVGKDDIRMLPYKDEWPLSWLVALLQAVGAWADNEGPTRTRRFDVDEDNTDRRLVEVVARAMHALAMEFVGDSDLGTVPPHRLAQLGSDTSVAAILGRHYRLTEARATVEGQLGPKGRFARAAKRTPGHRFALEVEVVRRGEQMQVVLHRSIAGLVVGEAKHQIGELLVERTLDLAKFFSLKLEIPRQSPPVDFKPQDFARFVQAASTSGLVVARLGPSRRYVALLHAVLPERSVVAVYQFEALVDELDESEQVLGINWIVCMGGRWGDRPSNLGRLIVKGKDDDDRDYDGVLHAYISQLIRSLHAWVLTDER